MSEQIPSILVTLIVFNTSVAVYFNDLTKTKNMTSKNIKNIKNEKKHNKKLKTNIKNN